MAILTKAQWARLAELPRNCVVVTAVYDQPSIHISDIVETKDALAEALEHTTRCSCLSTLRECKRCDEIRALLRTVKG
jgi:hypothetical protein